MSSMASLLLYLVAFSCSALLLYYGTKRSRKGIIVLSLSIPILIGGLRYGVGTDYFNYINIYNDLVAHNFTSFLTQIETNIELGFFLLMKLSEFITGDASFLFLISSFLTVLFFYLGLRRLDIKHPALFYFLYLLTIYPMTFNAVRQGIAISMCFFAFSFLIKSKSVQYFLWVAIAGFFHTTAFFLLPLYFVKFIVQRAANQAFIIYLLKLAIIATLIVVLLPQLFNILSSMSFFDQYNQYQNISAEGDNLTFYLKVAILMFIIIFSKWIIPRNNLLYLYVLCFAIFEIITIYLGFMSDPIKRMSLYFSFFSLLLLVNLPDIFHDKSGKLIAYIGIVGYGLVFFYISYYVLGQADVIPYNLVLGENL